MKIKKYVKKSSGRYKIVLEDNSIIDTYDDVILKNKLLYKDELTLEEFEKINLDNIYQEAYQKALKYINIRLRSAYEIKKYLLKSYEEDIVLNIIEKLKENNMLNDFIFAKAYTNDKMAFTTSGPYKIKNELKKHNIDNSVIDEVIGQIEEDTINNKINKQIEKIKNTNKNKKGYELRNKIYKNLITLGYSNDMIMKNLSIKLSD